MRQDRQRRGKGFAIQYALEHLAADAPDVVIIFDADCLVAPDSDASLQALAALAQELGRPVQADYVLAAPDKPTPRSVVSALALLIRARVRPRGLKRLGLPCGLGGSGMAFPWEVIRKAPEYLDHLVEDLAMGIDLAKAGHPPYCMHELRILSTLPERDQAAGAQRRRWEHGQLAMLLVEGPRMLANGLRTARLGVIGLGLDLMVPPLALLVSLQLALTAGGFALVVLGAPPVAATVAGGSLLALSGAVLLSWMRFAGRSIPPRFLLALPAYLVWKMPIYLSLLLGRREKNWVRTERRTEQAREPEPRS